MDENQTKKKKTNFSKLFVIFIILAIAGGGIYYYDTYKGKKIILTWIEKNVLIDEEGRIGTDNEDEKSQELDSSQENKSVEKTQTVKEEQKREILQFESDSKSVFRTYGKGFLQCTKDGVKFFEEIGSQKWNDTYTMKTPTVISEGQYTVVVELLGRQAIVYDKTGRKFAVSTEGNIIQVSLNTNGYLGVITNNKTGYQTLIYDKEGTEIGRRIEESEGVYPMSVEVSNDNRVFAVSYLDTTDIELSSKVLFFYIYKQDAIDYTDSMFASVEKPGELVPVLKYMQDGKLIAVSDKSVFAVNSDGKELWNFELTNHIEKVNFSDSQDIIIAYGEELSDKEGKKEGTVEWLSTNGTVSTTFESGEKVTYMNTKDNMTIIGLGKHYYNVKNTGKIIWEHTAIQDVSDILFMESESKVLFVTKNSAEIADMSDFEENTETIQSKQLPIEPEIIKEETVNLVPTETQKEEKSDENTAKENENNSEKKSSEEF